MRRTYRVIGVVVTVPLAVALSACSVNTLIWGAEGASVIASSEQLIEAAAAGDGASVACAGYEPDMREASDWQGLAAQEPERFVAEHWPDQVSLDPSWSINLTLPADRIASGAVYPGNVFYQETGDGLCLVDVAWSTVE